jgi:hypothetical protein
MTEAERGPRADNRLVDIDGQVGRDEQFPAEFADVGDPGGAGEAASEIDLSRGAKRECFRRHVGVGKGLQQLA